MAKTVQLIDQRTVQETEPNDSCHMERLYAEALDNEFQCLPALSIGCHALRRESMHTEYLVSMPTGIIHRLPRT